MNKKGLVFGIIVIILAVIGILGYVLYKNFLAVPITAILILTRLRSPTTTV
jgi:hypothetical protein